jgi:hypothetical protein
MCDGGIEEEVREVCDTSSLVSDMSATYAAQNDEYRQFCGQHYDCICMIVTNCLTLVPLASLSYEGVCV